MKKYVSEIISCKDIKVETDRYWTEDKRVEVVKLTHVPTGLNQAVHSEISQLRAYNIALKRLEEKYKSNK